MEKMSAVMLGSKSTRSSSSRSEGVVCVCVCVCACVPGGTKRPSCNIHDWIVNGENVFSRLGLIHISCFPV